MKDYKDFLEQPLLEIFKTAAPGTVRHSEQTASIAEAIAAELPDVDKELLKVAALFHDVGKMLHPLHFTENQDEYNIHDDLKPAMSFQLVSRHPSDTAMILIQNDFPPEIIKVAIQHHGTSIIVPFYEKSDKKNPEAFRYKTAKPETTEACILMIADSIDAAARSLFLAGKLNKPKERTDLIENKLNQLADDEQLDELKVKELRVIKAVLKKELDAQYHSRVSYDQDEGGTKEDIDES